MLLPFTSTKRCEEIELRGFIESLQKTHKKVLDEKDLAQEQKDQIVTACHSCSSNFSSSEGFKHNFFFFLFFLNIVINVSKR